MRIWIMGEDQTPQRFPLRRVIKLVRAQAHASSDCILTKSCGHGEPIRNMEISAHFQNTSVAKDKP